ncbi:MAG TPA: tRNA (guanosine(37)-N1)-methyltransferase TrmD [Firmicutes bacterium]|nr:tRNA (guanosine(37)-N1)-methyltransferase TrmD [Bacillota bacterium]
MTFCVLTLFPDTFLGVVSSSILRRAIEAGIVDVELVNVRDYTEDKHKTADDYPYGGGSGMVMKLPPLARAITDARNKYPGCSVVLMSAQGQLFNQELAWELSKLPSLVLVCGHYEGVDDRVAALCDMEISIGDFVLTGGELAAAVVIDAVSRLVPGVLGNRGSAITESFSDGLLEGPQYTRPAEWQGLNVPEVLISGNHERIRLWRRSRSLERTILRRPDLMVRASLTEEDFRLIEELKWQAD